MRRRHTLEVKWWERCGGEAHRGPSLQLLCPSLQLLARLGRGRAQGSTTVAPLSKWPVEEQGSLLSDFRVGVTPAGTVGSSPI